MQWHLPCFRCQYFSSSMCSAIIFTIFSLVGRLFSNLDLNIVYFNNIMKLFMLLNQSELPKIPQNMSFQFISFNYSKFSIANFHICFTLPQCKNRCMYVSGSCWQREHKLSVTKLTLLSFSFVYTASCNNIN